MTFSQEIAGILLLFLIFAVVIIKDLIDGEIYFDRESFEIRVSNISAKGDDYNNKMPRMWS